MTGELTISVLLTQDYPPDVPGEETVYPEEYYRVVKEYMKY